MKFLLSTGSLWSYSVRRCFAFAAEAGFDGIEVVVDQRWETRQANVLREFVDSFQLPVLAIHSPFWPNVPGWPTEQPARIKASIKLAEAVGAEVVVHHLPERVGKLTVMTGERFFQLPIPFWNKEEEYRRWLLEDYVALRERTAVQLCIENMPAYRRFGRRWNLYHWNSLDKLVAFPAITLDTTHLGTWGLEPFRVYSQLNGHVRHVHLSNFDGREHRRPETGNLRLDRLLQLMVNDGYEGAVTLELFPETLAAGAADETVVGHLASSLHYCRQWTMLEQVQV